MTKEAFRNKVVVVTGILDFLPKIKQILARILKKVPTGRITPLSGKKNLKFIEALSDGTNLSI